LRKSTKRNWDSFWKSKNDIHEVYSNADRILRNLSAITDLTGKRVLEIGAGTGRDSFGLVRLGAEVVQLDYSEASLELIRRLRDNERIRVQLIQADAFNLPFPDGSFDVVFHQGLLEHFREKDAQRLLAENVRVLRRGGLLLVDVPQRYHIYTIIKHILILFNRWFAGWEREFSIGELRKLMKAQGLIIIHSYGEWMYPSLFYRMLRGTLQKLGVRLPMYPKIGGRLTNLRWRIRERAWRWPLVLYTAVSIGVLGQKR
jgi:ubiquinone/menaquinone biosynthesis C-methylase UbiE